MPELVTLSALARLAKSQWENSVTTSLSTTTSFLESLQSEIEAAHVVCLTQGGKSSAHLEIDRRHKPVGARGTKHVIFIIPQGYRKQSMSKKIDTRFSAGGSIEWANDDPHEGTIILKGWADAFGYVDLIVSNVTAVKEAD
jgi:hypothetical protein